MGVNRTQQIWDKNLIKAFKYDNSVGSLLHKFVDDVVSVDRQLLSTQDAEGLVDFMASFGMKRFFFFESDSGDPILLLKPRVRPSVCACSERLGYHLLTAFSEDESIAFDVLLNINNYEWKAKRRSVSKKAKNYRNTVKRNGRWVSARGLSAGWGHVK